MPTEPKSASRLFHKAAQAGIPLDGTFELTPLCNMSCEMCYVRKVMPEVQAQGGLIAADRWYQLAVEARRQGMLFLLLTGGEPFTYPGFRDLYKRLKDLGLMIAINSNGTLLDEETVQWLATNPPYRMQITLYGASNETYARLCHLPDGFDRVMRAIELLKKYKIHFKLNACLTPANVGDLEEIYRIAEKYNLYVQATSYMFPPLRRDVDMVGQNFRFSPEEAGRIEAQIDLVRFGSRELQERIFGLEELRRRREQQYAEEDCGRDPYEPMGCRAGRSCFWVNWKGQMTACGMQNDPHTLPFEEGLESAWDKVRRSTAEVRLPVKCTTCSNRRACMVCGAAVYCENGSMNNEAPEYLCRMTESYVAHLDRLKER